MTRAIAVNIVLSASVVILQAAAPTPVNGLWVYSVTSLPSPVTDAPTRDTLIQNASASFVNMLYVSVYSSTPNNAGRLLYDETAIATFIGKAHAQGMQVYAALGDPDWPSSLCAVSATPYKRFADIAGYNSANPSAKFDGIILDVEPGSSPDFSALLGLYQCFQQQTHASGLGLAAAINAFWNTQVTFNQVTKEAYKQIVDLKLNSLVVMGYRNFAGTLNCSQGDGVVCLDENIIAYADSVGLGNTIVVGLNTDNPATAGDLPEETFYSMGQAAMNSVAQSIFSQFAAANETFGGFAIHNYRDSYLNGTLAGWPATNPTPLLPLPQFSAAGVTNSASFLNGSLAPGELITIFGQNLGPATPQSLQVANGTFTTSLGGVSVLLNNVAAPMVMASNNQVNAIVPFEVQGPTATLQLVYAGLTSATVTLPVATTAPTIFTADSSGKGPAAALYAPSVVTLYMTGAGKTTPAGVDGLVNANAAMLPGVAQTVTAQIGGQTATVLYAGNSVGIVSGVIQLNLQVPAGLAPGPQPVNVRIGAVSSQPGVTVAPQ